MRKVFINDFGRLRSGWRALIFLGLFLAIFFFLVIAVRVAYVALQRIVPSTPYAFFFADLVFRVILTIPSLAAGYFCGRFLENVPWRALGLSLHQGWFRDLALGYVIGFAALALAVGIATAAGGLRFTFAASGAIVPALRSLVGATVLISIAALAEEALFRGYPLQTFTRARLNWFGLLLTSLIFGAVHLSNPNVVGLTFTNTVLAGVWLAVAYLRTRSLWFPLGLHWSWNWALGWFFSLPVSGLNLVSHPLLQGTDLGPAWLTGGSYGIEGGVACTIALVAVTLFIWRTRLVSATLELKKLTSEENPVLTSPVLSTRTADDAA
jgi:membrane protease YdiL (CAAX protease family)